MFKQKNFIFSLIALFLFMSPSIPVHSAVENTEKSISFGVEKHTKTQIEFSDSGTTSESGNLNANELSDNLLDQAVHGLVILAIAAMLAFRKSHRQY